MKAKASSPKGKKAAPISAPVPSLFSSSKGIVQACMIFYNDGPALMEAALTSIKGKVDRIICVDGPFKEFPHEKPYSTDGCLDIAKKYADEVVECTEAWEDQRSKRCRYFNLAGERDYYLPFDTDEIFTGEIPKDLSEDFYAVPMKDVQSDGTFVPLKRIRLFRHQEGIHYHLCHAEVWIKNRPLFFRRMKAPFPEAEGLIIEHHPYRRSKERLAQDARYMDLRKENARLNSPINTMNYMPSDNVACCMMYFSGVHYSGDDGFGKTITVKKGETCYMSPEARNGVLESWPEQWRVLEEYNANN